jgi:hypothetical protein
VTRRATDRRPSLGILLGLPGEVLALTADGSLYVQDLFAPGGAQLAAVERDGRWLEDAVEETSVFDLGELEVLVAPAVPGDGASLRITGRMTKAPLGALAGRATGLAGGGPLKRMVWKRTQLKGIPEVSGLALVVASEDESDAGLAVRFALRAPRGAIAEVELLDAKTYRPRARGRVFQPRDGLVRHAAPLRRTPVRFHRGRCLLSVHMGGKVLSAREEEIG